MLFILFPFLVRELPEEVPQAPQRGRHDVLGACALQVRQAQGVQKYPTQGEDLSINQFSVSVRPLPHSFHLSTHFG